MNNEDIKTILDKIKKLEEKVELLEKENSDLKSAEHEKKKKRIKDHHNSIANNSLVGKKLLENFLEDIDASIKKNLCSYPKMSDEEAEEFLQNSQL